MINTSTIKQQQNPIDTITTELEKENKDSISILTTLLNQKRAALKEIQSIPAKISRALDTLVPITTEYPDYKKAIASRLGLILPPPPKPRVIEIEIGDSEGSNHQTKEKQHITPTNETITEVSSNPPSGKVDNETESNNGPINPDSETLVEKLEELAQVGLQHNLTIKINTQQLTGYVLAPHPNTEKLHPVVTFNLNNLKLSQGWLWQYNINIDNDNYHNICYTGSPTDFVQVLTRCAKYYFEKPVNNLITKLTEDFPLNWKHNKITNRWTKTLTEKESKQLTQNTKNPTGIIQLHTGFHQWNFNTKSQILTLEENNNDTTSDNNAETDSTYINKSGDAPTPPTSDTVESKNTPNKPTVTWYNSSSGEVEVGSEKRYFQILWNSRKNQYQVGLKKSLSSQKWRKDKNPTAQKFVDAIMGEFQEYKPNAANTKAEETTKNQGKTSDCWYTPPEVIKPVIEVLETINIDPCSDNGKHIPATTHYTITEDGLNQQWLGKVFINPPYSCPSKWIEKLLSEIDSGNVTEAIALLPASTDTKWFEPLWTQPLCFWKGRIKFLDENYKPKSPARQSHCFIYWGKNIDKFNEIFGKFGEVVLPKEDSQNIEIEPKEKAEKTLTFSQKIQPYLPPTWEIEEHLFDQVIIKEKTNQNNHVKLSNSTMKDIYIKHNQELLYTVNHQDIETAIDLISCWFEQQKSVKTPSINDQNSNNNSGKNNESAVANTSPKEDKKLPTLAEQIKPYLPKKWIIEEHSFDQVILQEKHHKNNHVQLIDCLNGDIRITHNIELLYIVQSQEIETAIDLIYSWFEQQNTVKTPSINDKKSNNNNSRQIESTVEYQGTKTEQKTLTFSQKIQQYLPETWVLENNFFDQVTIRENTHINSNYVKLTDCLNGEINIHHKKELLYTVESQNIEVAIDLIYWWFDQAKTSNKLDKFIEIINNYDTDLTIEKKDSSIAYINCGQKTLGTIFYNDPGKFLYPALTKSYRVGGKRVGYVRLTHKPYQEKLVDMPDSDLAAEGFPQLSKQQFINRFFDSNEQQEVWAIGFEFIPNTPNKEKPEVLSKQKKNQTNLEEKLINKVEKELSILDKFSFQRSLGIPKITLQISLKDEILGKIFTDTHEGLVSDIPLEKSLRERYGLDIKSLILDVVNGKQLQIENYCKHPENHTTTKSDTEIIENTADDFFDKYDDPMWLNLIKAEIECLEDFKASHDEVNLTVTHYGTYIGSIHHNQDDELEVEQKLIGELAKYDFDLEAFLVAENIPYQLYYPKPVVVIPTTNETDTQTLASKNKSVSNSCNGSKAESSQLNDNANTTSTSTENFPVNLLDKLAAVFKGFDNIRTKRSETTLWFYRGDENLYPCLMQTRDGETFTLFPTVKLKSHMKQLFGIDIDQVCDDLEAGKSIDINDYVDQSIWEQTIKESSKNNETITWSDILNNAAINDTTDSQTKNELNTSTTTEESNTDSYQHPEGLHWLKDTSIYNRSETYIVWNGTQKCGKINLCNKRKNKAGFGKWYISPNVFGPYYDTIEKAATACLEDFISKKATPTEAEEDLIPF